MAVFRSDTSFGANTGNIPGFGELFVSNSQGNELKPGDSINTDNFPESVFFRTPNGIVQISLRELGGRDYRQRTGKDPNSVHSLQHAQRGLELFQQQTGMKLLDGGKLASGVRNQSSLDFAEGLAIAQRVAPNEKSLSTVGVSDPIQFLNQYNQAKSASNFGRGDIGFVSDPSVGIHGARIEVDGLTTQEQTPDAPGAPRDVSLTPGQMPTVGGVPKSPTFQSSQGAPATPQEAVPAPTPESLAQTQQATAQTPEQLEAAQPASAGVGTAVQTPEQIAQAQRAAQGLGFENIEGARQAAFPDQTPQPQQGTAVQTPEQIAQAERAAQGLGFGSIEEARQVAFPEGGTIDTNSPSLPPASTAPTGDSGVSNQPFDPNQLVNDLLSKYGVSANSNDFQVDPLKSFQDTYGDIYERLGLGEVKSNIEGIIKSLNEDDEKLAEEISKINENPWLSEGLRSKKIKAAQDRSDRRKEGKTETLQLLQGVFDDGRQDARFAAATALTQFNADRNFAQDQLEFKLNMFEMLAESDRKLNELDTQVVEADGRKKLINTKTGQTIADLGSADTLGAGGGAPLGISPITKKPFTQDQSASGRFAVRMNKAEDSLDDGKLFRNIAPDAAQFLKSDARRQFEQAEANWITANLRKESGANIAESEFADARRVYIPQFGDSDEVLAQKTLARQAATEGMILQSVGFYEQLQGLLPPEERGSFSGQTGQTSSGIKYTIE